MAEHFHSLRVAEIVPETSEANSIRFEIPPDLRDKFAFKAGQHLTLRATIGGEEVRRNVGSSRVDLQACKLEYSIVSPK